MRNFLLGVLVGCTIMYSMISAVEVYKNLNQRLSYVEGYISGLDQYLRQGR